MAARDILEILGGKPPQEIPVVHGPSVYMFNWRELKRWRLDQRKLPAASAIRFRPTTIWERHELAALTVLLYLQGCRQGSSPMLFEETAWGKKGQEIPKPSSKR